MSQLAIDTNIFQHLLNPQMNTNLHIDKVLGYLARSKCMLLVDSTKKIANEYEALVIPIIRNADDTRVQIYLLRYWMNSEIRHEEPLDRQDQLMQQIKRVIYENEHADRAFVYVSCKRDCYLITNDNVHILNRRRELLEGTRRHRGTNTDFIDSHQAHQEFVANEAAAD